jgi:hypothetical protein
VAKISFGIIALNALPFLEYNLRALYPFAHEIIIVEGAATAAKSLARPNGHSADGTLEVLETFQREYDPDGKVHIVTAREAGYSSGYWPEKDEMSQAYARRATGDWLWQVDSDEFYFNEDIQAISLQLDSDPQLTGMSFPYIEFFGSFETYTTGVWHLYEHPRFARLFRWGNGFQYAAHRPPTVLDAHGKNLREGKWLSDPKNAGRSIFLYHYSYVLPKQAMQKVGYYSNVSWTDTFKNNQSWFENQYLTLKNPLYLGERGDLQWLEAYNGQHPEIINEMRRDLASGQLDVELRPKEDMEQLLSSPLYALEKALLKAFLWFYWPIRVGWKRIRAKIVNLVPLKTDSGMDK